MRKLLPVLLFLIAPALVASPPVASILCYHEVERAETMPQFERIPRKSATESSAREKLRYTAYRSTFLEHLDYLQSNGYTVIPLDTLVQFLNGKIDSLPPRAVVITVDDGWACAFTEIHPEMKRRSLPWTLYVYPKIVGRGAHAVTWKQLEELAGAGVDVQSHSLTHPFLTQRNNAAATAEYDEFLCRELLESRLTLQQVTGKPVRHLCYPFGDYDEHVAVGATLHGYDSAVTTEKGFITRETPPMKLNRFLVHNDTTIEEFRSFLID